MIKKWNQFIKESVDYWSTTKEVSDIFIGLQDEDYIISVEKGVFNDVKDYLDPENDTITLGEYYLGYKITILQSPDKSKRDVTIEFKTSLSALKSEGYIIEYISDDDDRISPDNIHFINGAVITWIPEKSGKPLTDNEEDLSDGDIYISSYKCELYIYQPEKTDLKPKDLAQIYQWGNYITKGDEIYCEIDIDDLSDVILSRNSPYKDQLINGIELYNYETHYYQPDTQNLFGYNLSKENEILSIKCLIKEMDGLENLIEESDNDELKGKSEDEVINFLLKERFYHTLENLCEDSEIIGDIKQMVADWEAQAHCDRNEEELHKAFDRILEREKIKFEKVWKEGKRFFYRKDRNGNKEKVWYNEMIWWYILEFESRWMTDYNTTMFRENLITVFKEWAGNSYFDYTLEPHFSDYGDVDRDEMNKDIEGLLKGYLKQILSN
jgi:hypothetical protein